jgi:hypothetical protein
VTPDAARRVEPRAGRQEALARLDELARHHAIEQDPLRVIAVVDEVIERADALLEAALDAGEVRGLDDPRHDVEGEDPLRAGLVAVDVERDAHRQERALGGVLAPGELFLGDRAEARGEQLAAGARLAGGLEHLVVRAAEVVVVEVHARRRRG